MCGNLNVSTRPRAAQMPAVRKDIHGQSEDNEKPHVLKDNTVRTMLIFSLSIVQSSTRQYWCSCTGTALCVLNVQPRVFDLRADNVKEPHI